VAPALEALRAAGPNEAGSPRNEFEDTTGIVTREG
jgi:hypothetical protein